MLQSLRSGARSPIMKFFLLFLAGGFALWGIGDGTTGLIGGSDKAISAGDASVSPREVAIEFERTRRSFLTNTTTEEALQGGLLNEVVGALSRDVLIRAEAKNLGLTVTRAMQSDAIRNDAGFKDDFGKFSEGRFTQALAGAGLSETEYLQRVGGALMRDQLIGALAAGSRFDRNSASIIAAYDLERRTVRLTSFAVDTDSVSAPDDATLDKYFAKNKTTYDAPILRTVKVASISAEMIAKDIKISADDIKTAYDNRQDEFTTAETRDLRQMVFESKADAKTALDRLAKGESFAAVAKDMLSLTEADTKLGRMSKDALDAALADAAFSAEINKPVGPVESPFGQHIVLVDAITEGGTTSLAEASPKIEAKLRAEKAIDLLYDRANQLEDSLGTGASLSEAAAKVGGRVDSIQQIDRNGLTIDGTPVGNGLAPLVQDSGFLDLVWNTPIGDISVLQEGSDDVFFVAEVVAETPARARPLAEVRDRVIADWKQTQAIKSARAQADKAALNTGDSGTLSEPFRRNGTGLDHQAARLIATTAFKQEKGNSSVIETGREAIVVKTVDILPAKADDVKTASDYVGDLMNNAMREDMLNILLISLADKHDLQLNTAPVRQLLIGSR